MKGSENVAEKINMIKGYRVACNITQEQMAKELGVSDTTYRNMELNNTFTLDQMKVFTKVINVVEPSVKLEDIFLN